MSTLAVRSLSASTPELADELRDIDRGVEHAVAGHRDRAISTRPSNEEEDLIGRVPLMAQVRPLAVGADAALKSPSVRTALAGTPSSSGVATMARDPACSVVP